MSLIPVRTPYESDYDQIGSASGEWVTSRVTREIQFGITEEEPNQSLLSRIDSSRAYTRTQDLTLWSRVERSGVKDAVEQICFDALSRAWPVAHRGSVQEGTADSFDGARAVRVLVAVLLIALEQNSLVVVVGLDKLAVAAGFANHYSVRDALFELDKAGLLSFSIGTQDTYEDGEVVEYGKPSVITLVPASGCRFDPRLLPRPTLDAFCDRQAGTPGWFAVARMCFEWLRDDTDIEHPNIIVNGYFDVAFEGGIGAVVALTGMTYERCKRLLPKLAAAREECKKVGRKYSIQLDPFVGRNTRSNEEGVLSQRIARQGTKERHRTGQDRGYDEWKRLSDQRKLRKAAKAQGRPLLKTPFRRRPPVKAPEQKPVEQPPTEFDSGDRTGLLHLG